MYACAAGTTAWKRFTRAKDHWDSNCVKNLWYELEFGARLREHFRKSGQSRWSSLTHVGPVWFSEDAAGSRTGRLPAAASGVIMSVRRLHQTRFLALRDLLPQEFFQQNANPCSSRTSYQAGSSSWLTFRGKWDAACSSLFPLICTRSLSSLDQEHSDHWRASNHNACWKWAAFICKSLTNKWKCRNERCVACLLSSDRPLWSHMDPRAKKNYAPGCLEHKL